MADRGPDGRSTDIASGDGTPRWIAATLRYCSRCGAPLAPGDAARGEPRAAGLRRCGFIAYVNPRLVVTTIPVTDDGRGWSCCGGASSPGAAGGRSRAGSSRWTRRSPRPRSARRSRRPGCSSCRARSWGCTRGSRRPWSSLAFEAPDRRRRGADDARGARGAAVRAGRRSRGREIAFKTSFFAIRDWVRLRHPDAPRPPPSASRPRSSGGDQPRSMNTFLSSVYCSSASRPRSLPIPDCL